MAFANVALSLCGQLDFTLQVGTRKPAHYKSAPLLQIHRHYFMVHNGRNRQADDSVGFLHARLLPAHQ